DRKGVGVITGAFGPASGDESIGTAVGGGEDHERADRETEPGMASGEAAYAYLDPENPLHRATILGIALPHRDYIARSALETASPGAPRWWGVWRGGGASP